MKDNLELGRYELIEDGKLAWADYEIANDTLILLHVEAHPALRGKGTAGRLMTGILEKTREQGRPIRPVCGYAASWLKRHGSATIS